MNIRKNIDYTDMYAALDSAMGKNLSQVVLYYKIGKAVCGRTEKGAAVAAAAYLSKQYPDVQGFSPRNIRRMRDFYHVYEGYPDLLTEALKIGWTQNVVIMEAGLTMEVQGWYLKATKQFGWTKMELIGKIETNAHEKIVFAIDEEVCYIEGQNKATNQKKYNGLFCNGNKIQSLIRKGRCQVCPREVGRRRWLAMSFPIFTKKRVVFMC